jgi:glycosyltransferase involved in cell wall biosynthesis
MATISVVVAVRGRPDHLATTLASVLAQRLPESEATVEALVVIGPEEQEPEFTAGAIPVRVLRATGSGLGAARAAALTAAAGEFLAVCDAGDAWAPDCLATLLAPFAAEPDVVLAYAVAVDVATGGITLASPADEAAQRAALEDVAPCAVIVKVATARSAGGYIPSLTAAADVDLWLRLGQIGTPRAVAASGPVTGGTSAPLAIPAKRTRDEEAALAAELAHLERIEAHRRERQRLADRFVERRAASPHEPFDPATWGQAPAGRRDMIWHSQFRRTRRLGLVGRRLLLAVERQGIVPLITPFSGEVPADLLRFAETPARWNRLAFLFDPLAPPGALRVERLTQYAAWETTDVPRSQVEAINRSVELLCVPSRQNRDDALAAGVQVPVALLPPGVDPAEFPLLARPAREPFTFGAFAEPSPRAGSDVLLRAFAAAFRPDEPVRLLVKGVEREPGNVLPDWALEDARIDYRGGWLEHEDLLALLGEFDACVLPTRSAAFGLRGLEAMATGLPTIATAWGAAADYLDPVDSLALGSRPVAAGGVEVEGERLFGQWAEPDETQLVELLRWVYENREAAATMGRAAAGRVRAGWTWDHAAARLRDALAALAAGASPP